MPIRRRCRLYRNSPGSGRKSEMPRRKRPRPSSTFPALRSRKDVLAEGLTRLPARGSRMEPPWLVLLPENALLPAAMSPGTTWLSHTVLDIWADSPLPAVTTAALTSLSPRRSERKKVSMTASRFTKAKITIFADTSPGPAPSPCNLARENGRKLAQNCWPVQSCAEKRPFSRQRP